MNLSAIGKTLDQPLLINSLKDKTPKLLTVAALGYGIYDTLKVPKKERKERGIKNAIILSSTVSTSLLCAFGLKIGKKQIFKGLVNMPEKDKILAQNKNAVEKFIKLEKPDKKIENILNKTQRSHLNFKETEAVLNSCNKSPNTNQLFDTLFSKKDSLSAKEIFKETGRLSILGLTPVAAGVASGIAADKITNCSTPELTSDKIKEGAFQFFANIFMCNVGAAGALFGAEKLFHNGIIKSLSPLKKLFIIMGGIFATGIMGGSVVANLIGKKFLDPIFDKKPENEKKMCADAINSFTSKYKVYDKFKISNETIVCAEQNRKKQNNAKIMDWLYSERKPEPLDLALHLDDVATAGVLSGFKWIEPMLPLMYTISGYRAGIGYRNN